MSGWPSASWTSAGRIRYFPVAVGAGYERHLSPFAVFCAASVYHSSAWLFRAQGVQPRDTRLEENGIPKDFAYHADVMLKKLLRCVLFIWVLILIEAAEPKTSARHAVKGFHA